MLVAQEAIAHAASTADVRTRLSDEPTSEAAAAPPRSPQAAPEPNPLMKMLAYSDDEDGDSESHASDGDATPRAGAAPAPPAADDPLSGFMDELQSAGLLDGQDADAFTAHEMPAPASAASAGSTRAVPRHDVTGHGTQASTAADSGVGSGDGV